MRHKQLAAAEERAAAKDRAAAMVRERKVATEARAQEAIAEQAHELEVVPWLRQLGFRAREARDAAALCGDMRHASLEERVRVALSYFHVRGTRVVRAGAGLETAASRARTGAVGATGRALSEAR